MKRDGGGSTDANPPAGHYCLDQTGLGIYPSFGGNGSVRGRQGCEICASGMCYSNSIQINGFHIALHRIVHPTNFEVYQVMPPECNGDGRLYLEMV